jgi:hypothetical protein
MKYTTRGTKKKKREEKQYRHSEVISETSMTIGYADFRGYG